MAGPARLLKEDSDILLNFMLVLVGVHKSRAGSSSNSAALPACLPLVSSLHLNQSKSSVN